MSMKLTFDERLFDETRKAVEQQINQMDRPESRKELIEAANQGVINALRRHFADRQKEQPKSTGFPWFGQVYPKRYFWRGTRGTSLAEQIQVKLSSPSRMEGVVGIDSPALKHKLAANPPPITPSGGRRYLAIPANPAASEWKGMPRDFPAELAFRYRPTPEGHWLPCLVADSKYRKANGRLASSGKGGRSGELTVVYWLVHQVRTKRDPNALPTEETMKDSATRAVAGVIRRLFK